MANSRMRCAGCRQYKPRDQLSKVGLSSVCSDDPSCRRAILDRQKQRVNARIDLDKKRNSRLPGKMRKSIRNRDMTCRYCGQEAYRMEIHHISYRSQGGPDTSWNLILLCDEHHRMAHSRKKYWQPVLRAYIWLWYVEGRRNLLVPGVERLLRKWGLLPGQEADPDDGQLID